MSLRYVLAFLAVLALLIFLYGVLCLMTDPDRVLSGSDTYGSGSGIHPDTDSDLDVDVHANCASDIFATTNSYAYSYGQCTRACGASTWAHL